MEENHIMEKRKDREDQSMYWKKACKLTAVLGLAVMLQIQTVSAAAISGGEGSYYPEKEHAGISLADMERELFDEEALREAANEIDRLCSQEGQQDRLEELYQTILEQTNRLYTESALASLDYYSNMEDEEARARMEEVDGSYAEMMDIASGALRTLLNSGYGSYFREKMGDDSADYYQSYEDLTEEESALLERQQELVQEYEEKSMEEYGSQEERCSVLGEIYLELVQVRTEMAETAGYDNYADYAYENEYYRDYTIEDVEDLREDVKNLLVPYFYEFTNEAVDAGVNDVFLEYDVSSENLLAELTAPLGQMNEEVGETFQYFQDCRLYDLDQSDVKMDMAYTVELPAYGDAYVYDNRYGTYYDVFTIIHEFGHFNSVYHDDTPALFSMVNMDVSEIHSQGLELLFYPYYGEVYQELGTAMQHYVIYEMLYNILLSCAFDEAENVIYRNPDMTLDEINSLMDEISAEYGLMGQSVGSDVWVDVTHLFQQPFYMISYATSAFASLELFQISAADREEAVDIYMQISASGTAEPFCAVLEQCGLTDIFQDGATEQLIDGMDTAMTAEHGPDSQKTDSSGEDQNGGEGQQEEISGIRLPDWLNEHSDGIWQELQQGLGTGIRDTSFGGYRVLALAVTVSIVAAAVISILLARHIRKKNDRDKKDEKDNWLYR